MSGMNDYLAEVYGTAAQQPNEDAQKTAQAEMFAKLAADNGIDLSKLNDNQIAELWNTVFENPAAKTAGEHGHHHGHKEKEHEEKKAQAAAFQEWLQTKEAQAQWAQADFAGRQMAHAYVAELRKIAYDGGLDFLNKEETLPTNFFKTSSVARVLHKEKLRRAGEAALEFAKKHTGHAVEFAKKHKGHAAAAAGGVVGGGAAGYAVGRKKKASAMTEAAVPIALQMIASHDGATEHDVKTAADRIGAVLTLGFDDSNTKVAAADEFPQAVQIRALELLEAAGYPVDWQA